VIRFIAEHKDHQEPGPDAAAGLTWGVEPLCAVLSEHGVQISPSTYYEWVDRRPTKPTMSSSRLVRSSIDSWWASVLRFMGTTFGSVGAH
jgi:putative transposase